MIFQETSFSFGPSEDTVITKAPHGASPLGSEDDGPQYQRTWLQWAIPEVPGDPLPKPQPPDPLGPQTPRPSPSLPSNPLRASPPPLSGSSARLLEAGLWQRPASAFRRTRKGSLPLSAFHFPEVLGAVGRAGSKSPRLGIANPSPRLRAGRPLPLVQVCPPPGTILALSKARHLEFSVTSGYAFFFPRAEPQAGSS